MPLPFDSPLFGDGADDEDPPDAGWLEAGHLLDLAGVGLDQLVKAADRLPLALEQVDLGLHERGLAGDVDELSSRGRRRSWRWLTRPRRGELFGRHGELVGRCRAARLVAGGLGLRLGDQKIDLVDLGLDGRRLGSESRGELFGGQHAGGDLNPPAS